jgi:thiosulfate dehydrogenase
MRFLLGLIFGIVLVPLAVLAFLTYGNVPVGVSDQPIPHEAELVHIPLNARIQKEMISTRMQPDLPTLTAGARIYTERCAFCHGLHNKPAAVGVHMYPAAPQLLQAHHNDPNVVGVSDDPVGETYWKVENGIRLTGMPALKSQLNDTEMWQVSVFLANANKPMPPAALDILNRAPTVPAEASSRPTPNPTPQPDTDQ